MRNTLILAVVALGMTACATASNVVADGQLFCAAATPAGPLVVALADAAGAPVTVTNQSAAFVSAACAVADAIPVTPPPAPAAAPVVAVNLPSSS